MSKTVEYKICKSFGVKRGLRSKSKLHVQVIYAYGGT
jgi:hypothetical protein